MPIDKIVSMRLMPDAVELRKRICVIIYFIMISTSSRGNIWIVGNWKMNPATVADARRIIRKARTVAAKLERTDVTVCPPFPFISAGVSRSPAPHFTIGAQSISVDADGPHTGEVSAAMLKDLGVQSVIIGHSEQRARGDSGEKVSRQAIVAVESGLTAIVCVGEASRDEGGAYFDGLKSQIKASLAGVSPKQAKSIVIAYEPIWAIGGQEAMSPGQIHEAALFIKKTFADLFGSEAALKTRVLYGGSVNFRNAADIISIGKVDGLLVGRESVNIPGFVELLKAVDAISA